MDNKNRSVAIITITTIIAVALITALFFGTKAPVDIDSGQRMVMGTFARIVAVAEDETTANKCIEAAFKQLRSVEDLMSYHKNGSEISKINHNAYEGSVNVSKSTFEVLQKSVEFSRLSGGAFDITIGPLSDLWRSASDANSVPSDDELAKARSKVGYEKLILDANEMSVRFVVEGMKLDVGGIAKGYAIDKAVEAMKNYGALGGMIDIGGDIRCFGAAPRGKKHWLIGLQDPSRTEDVIGSGRYSLVLKLTDTAVATSGDYRRFVLIGGKKYSQL